MTTATTHEKLGDLYRESLCQDAYYKGAAGTIVDAVLGSFAWLAATNPDLNTCREAASKLTRDAMGFMERTIGLIHDDWLSNKCDWARIDAYFYNEGNNDHEWVIEQLNEQQERVWKIYFDYAGRPDSTAGEGRERLGIRWHHDLALAATFLEAAAMLLSEVKS